MISTKLLFPITLIFIALFYFNTAFVSNFGKNKHEKILNNINDKQELYIKQKGKLNFTRYVKNCYSNYISRFRNKYQELICVVCQFLIITILPDNVWSISSTLKMYGSNQNLMDYVFGTITTMFYDPTGGA